MIGRIAGRLEYRAADHVLIDVKGVGYIVFVSDRVMATLPANGEAVALYTDLLVREDNLQLFGFSTMAGTAPVARGVAPTDAGAADDVLEPIAAPIEASGAAQSEALSALGNLGYGPSDAAGAVAQAAGENEDADTPTLIRAALKLLAPKG